MTERSDKITEWTGKIDALGSEAKKSYFAIGDALVECEFELEQNDFEAVVGGTFLKSLKHAENLMRVSRKKEFRDPEILRRLPLGIKPLIYLASEKWTREYLWQGIDKEIIHPHASRTEIKEWRDTLDADESEPDVANPHPDNDNGDGPKPKPNDNDYPPKPKGNGDGPKPKPKADCFEKRGSFMVNTAIWTIDDENRFKHLMSHEFPDKAKIQWRDKGFEWLLQTVKPGNDNTGPTSGVA